MLVKTTSPCLPAASPGPAQPGLPPQAGAGFKPQHLTDWLADPRPPAFVEVHAENYMGDGGAPHAQLHGLREMLPLSLHGVGLSIGSEAGLDTAHLERLARLVARYEPAAFSEHLAWSTHDHRFLNDLLPLVYDARVLDRVCAHVDQVQSRLGMRMWLENPSTYFSFADSTFDEPEFISRVVGRTGCGLLLDINNVHVSCHNQRRDPLAYLSALPLPEVGQVHLAGHACDADPEGNAVLIDNHGAPVSTAVWELYAHVLASTGPVATLVEWDRDVPDYAVLRGEVRRADEVLKATRAAMTGMAA